MVGKSLASNLGPPLQFFYLGFTTPPFQGTYLELAEIQVFGFSLEMSFAPIFDRARTAPFTPPPPLPLSQYVGEEIGRRRERATREINVEVIEY